jgi:myosin protein heavy chain
VEYEVANWLDKNKDPLQDDLQLAMKNSKHQFVANLFSDDFGLGGPAVVVSDAKTGMAVEQKKSGNLALAASGSSTQKGANFRTVATQYKEQLDLLMDTLLATNPHFVRCIIPNLKKATHNLVPYLVLEQLRCNGVLEGIRISRKGFPNRLPYGEFLRRYYILHPVMRRQEPGKCSIVFFFIFILFIFLACLTGRPFRS